jgi:hypothetical protein
MCNFGILEWLDTDNLTDFLLAKASDAYKNTHAPASTPTRTSPSHSLTASSSAVEDEGTSSARSSNSNPEQRTGAIPQHPKTGATVPLAGQETAIQSCSSSKTSTAIRFAAPKTNEEIEEARNTSTYPAGHRVLHEVVGRVVKHRTSITGENYFTPH